MQSFFFSSFILFRVFEFGGNYKAINSIKLRINGEVGNYGSVLPGRSVSPQVDSEKLKNELHS